MINLYNGKIDAILSLVHKASSLIQPFIIIYFFCWQKTMKKRNMRGNFFVSCCLMNVKLKSTSNTNKHRIYTRNIIHLAKIPRRSSPSKSLFSVLHTKPKTCRFVVKFMKHFPFVCLMNLCSRIDSMSNLTLNK